MSESGRHIAARFLGLAAAPTFAAMALATTFLESRTMAVICSATHGPAWLGGMAPMYWLMSAFHLAPWLNLVGPASKRHRGGRA